MHFVVFAKETESGRKKKFVQFSVSSLVLYQKKKFFKFFISSGIK